MKILIVHRYFWPDTAPAATILRSVAKRWGEDGHDVTVLSTQPGYSDPSIRAQPAKEELDGGTDVVRMRTLPETKKNYAARSLNYGLVFLRAGAHVLRHRDYDVVVGLTAPPLLPGVILGGAAQLTGASFVYHCGDIYPELPLRCGLMQPGWRAKLFSRIDTVTSKRSARVNVLSEDMRKVMLDRGVKADQITVINNLDLGEFSEDVEHVIPDRLVKPAGTRRVLFAGNIGRFQCLPTVVEAAHLLAGDPSITFDFIGTGAARAELEEAAAPLIGKTVFFHDRVSPGVASAVAADADVALVTLREGVISAAYPSKTMTYLRAGTPVLAMLEADSELGQMVTTEDLGEVVPPGDAQALAAAVLRLLETDRRSISARCQAAYNARFAREHLLDKWSEMASSIQAERSTPH